MVDSGFGRTDLAQIGERRPQSGRAPEAHDREVWKPWTLLPLVHAERLQPLVEIGSQRGRAPVLVVEDEHPNASGLAIHADGETRRNRARARVPQAAPDRVDLDGGTVTEKGEGDVNVAGSDDTDVAGVREDVALPVREALAGVLGKAKADEEPQSVTAGDATTGCATALCQESAGPDAERTRRRVSG